jgi:hypothetical protein
VYLPSVDHIFFRFHNRLLDGVPIFPFAFILLQGICQSEKGEITKNKGGIALLNAKTNQSVSK